MPELHERGNARSLETGRPTAALLPAGDFEEDGRRFRHAGTWSEPWVLAVDWAADADLAKIIQRLTPSTSPFQ